MLSFAGIGLIVIPISTATACGLSFADKVVFEMVMQKYNEYKNQSEKDQQITESFDKLYRKVYKTFKKMNTNFFTLFPLKNWTKRKKSFLQIGTKK